MVDVESFSVAALAAPHPLAAAAGRDVLAEGGNVVEAALAAAMVLGVVSPDRAGLGGDAVWLFREPGPRGRVRALDARGAVAAAASAAFYRDRGHEAVPLRGPEAVLAVPGAVAGWIEAQAFSAATGARLPVSRLLAPALAAARDGWDGSPRNAAIRDEGAPVLPAAPGPGQPAGGATPEAAARHGVSALAGTLEYLSAAGLDEVYRGDVARELAADLEALGCPLGRADLRSAAARWREPLALDLARHAFAMPPTRAGFGAAAALGLAAGLAAAGFDVAEADGFGRWHGSIEALGTADRLVARAVAAGRDMEAVLHPARLARLAMTLDRDRAARAEPPGRPLLDEAAAWIGAVDRDGAAVSVVHTLGSASGAGTVSARTGIPLGNRGAALAIDPALGPALRPGRRVPLASLPAVAASARDGRVAALGAFGQRAPAGLLQLADGFARGMGAGEALAAPRFALGAAADGGSAAVLVDGREPAPLKRLRAAGHEVAEGEAPWAGGIVLRDGSGRVSAAADGGEPSGI